MDISLSHMNIFEIELNCSISGETSLAWKVTFVLKAEQPLFKEIQSTQTTKFPWWANSTNHNKGEANYFSMEQEQTHIPLLTELSK